MKTTTTQAAIPNHSHANLKYCESRIYEYVAWDSYSNTELPFTPWDEADYRHAISMLHEAQTFGVLDRKSGITFCLSLGSCSPSSNHFES